MDMQQDEFPINTVCGNPGESVTLPIKPKPHQLAALKAAR